MAGLRVTKYAEVPIIPPPLLIKVNECLCFRTVKIHASFSALKHVLIFGVLKVFPQKWLPLLFGSLGVEILFSKAFRDLVENSPAPEIWPESFGKFTPIFHSPDV